jgi:non-ribosomal peptide synthetase component E (peptide arylation enzyme)
VETTSNDVLEQRAQETPDKLAIVDGRVRLSYGEYYRRAERLAAHFVGLGLGAGDVVAIQLPNWSEFAIAVNAAMMAGVPFCQFHSDFRSREVEFILRFTCASALIVPSRFRRFDYPGMVGALRPKLPCLRHLMVVGDELPPGSFDLRAFVEYPTEPAIDREKLRERRHRTPTICPAPPLPLAQPEIRKPFCTCTTRRTAQRVLSTRDTASTVTVCFLHFCRSA